MKLRANSLAASVIPPKVSATSMISDFLSIDSWYLLYVETISKKCFFTSLVNPLSSDSLSISLSLISLFIFWLCFET